MGRLTTKGYGKGFEHFMRHKDFHPSAWWNLKKVYIAREKKRLADQREKEMRAEYLKEQEWVNNRALLGDHKATVGLTFMYDAPPGLGKEPPPPKEPKYEWQRKYKPPREECARGRDDVYDKPFAIPVKQVRCTKCKTWGMHHRLDRECPFFNLTGNVDDPGASTRPSDIMKHYREAKAGAAPAPKAPAPEPPSAASVTVAGTNDRLSTPLTLEGKPRDWNDAMKHEFGFELKPKCLELVEQHERVLRSSSSSKWGADVDSQSTSDAMSNEEKKLILKFLCELPGEDRSRIIRAVFCDEDTEIIETRPEKPKKKKSKRKHKQLEESTTTRVKTEAPSEKHVKFELPDNADAIKNEADSDDELSSSLVHEQVMRARIMQRTRAQEEHIVHEHIKPEPYVPRREWPSDARGETQTDDEDTPEHSEAEPVEDWSSRKRKLDAFRQTGLDDPSACTGNDSDDSDYEWAAATRGDASKSSSSSASRQPTANTTTSTQRAPSPAASSSDHSLNEEESECEEDSDAEADGGASDNLWNSAEMQSLVNSTINELFAGL